MSEKENEIVIDELPSRLMDVTKLKKKSPWKKRPRKLPKIEKEGEIAIGCRNVRPKIEEEVAPEPPGIDYMGVLRESMTILESMKEQNLQLQMYQNSIYQAIDQMHNIKDEYCDILDDHVNNMKKETQLVAPAPVLFPQATQQQQRHRSVRF